MVAAGGGGETAKDVSAWTSDILKVYFERVVEDSERFTEQRFMDQEKAVAAALAAQEKAVAAALAAAALAVDKAEENAEKWRDAANEWRGAMDDRERDFMRSDQASVEFSNMRTTISELKELRGKGMGLNAAWGYLIGAVGLAAVIVTLFQS